MECRIVTGLNCESLPQALVSATLRPFQIDLGCHLPKFSRFSLKIQEI